MRVLTLAMVLGQLAGVPVFGQIAVRGYKALTPPPIANDPVSLYRFFFDDIIRPPQMIPNALDQRGLSDAEKDLIKSVAEDWRAKRDAIEDTGIVFEGRMRHLQTGQDQSEWIAQRLKEREALREHVILDHIQTLLGSLGWARLQELNAYVQQWSDWRHSAQAPNDVGIMAPAGPAPLMPGKKE